MPASSNEEMASLLDPALTHTVVRDEHEELRSQLLASIEQNRLAFAANKHVAQVKEPSPSLHDAVKEDAPNKMSILQAGNRTENGKEVQASTMVESPEDGPSAAMTAPADAADPLEVDTHMEDTTVDMINAAEETETNSPEENKAAGSEPDTENEGEDDYQDASSSLHKFDGNLVTVGANEAASVVDTDGASAVSDSGAEEDSDDDPDLCVFCEQAESAVTSTEDDVTCRVCRRPAHRVCFDAQGFHSAESENWECQRCAANGSSTSPKGQPRKPRQSASRLVRDLLPVSRGMQKPGAHSIFAQPLIQDDEGGRALRKRKSESDERIPSIHKRPKTMQETPKVDTIQPESICHSTRRSSQKLVLGLPPLPTARILQHRPYHKPPPHKFILAFRLDQSKIATVLAEPPRPHRRKYLKKKQKIPAPPPYQPPVPKFPALPAHNLMFPFMFGDRESDVGSKPYGGILSEAEAETSKSLPQMRDREIFEIARKEAEEERKRTSAKAEAEIYGSAGENANATNSKRTVSGPPSKIKCIQFGKYVIDTSYAAPYPEEYSHESRLFICEFCLKYLPSEFVAWRHKLKCPAKHPPGDEIYRDGSLSIWEVDGRKKTEYCQCLCLMAKLFLGSKTLYYDVDPFLFYVLTEYDEYGYHFVGYFSKEKRPASQNNVSCILVMPIHQRKGYATFLIEFSYLLTRLEGKEGSPEKPLSDMGLTAYRSYWDLTISRHLLQLGNKPFSVKDMMLRTGMTADDVVHSLERLYAFVRDPVTKAYAIRYDKSLYANIVDKYESKGFQVIREERLVWTPYIMGRSDAATLDAAPVNAIAQRPDDIIKAMDDEADRMSPQMAEQPPLKSPSASNVDPALLNEHGTVAPGPPPTGLMDDIQPTAVETTSNEPLANGDIDKGKAPAEPSVTGYALTYLTERIPQTRFQIDPPIPAAMLRNAKSKRKSITGTPRPKGKTLTKPITPQALRHSPRKAGSVNGSVSGRGASRMSSPDKVSASVRRSGRRSGLAKEVVVVAASNEEDDDDDHEAQEEEEEEEVADGSADEEDVEDEIEVNLSHHQNAIEVDSVASTSADEDASDRSDDEPDSQFEREDDASEEEEIEESNASDDPDAVVDEEEDEESAEEEEEDGEIEVDVPSAVSSTAVTDDEGENSSGGEE
ncbi:Histone acetyltransferase [Lithohypha guttulata]|uniref:Histone acetyltransferase n=1 Tax=Lithohypha guttulata TaxID=1690604 RepID=UPI002DDF6CE0|nr:Histone acetyltransferase [Lithohypha guttulata]